MVFREKERGSRSVAAPRAVGGRGGKNHITTSSEAKERRTRQACCEEGEGGIKKEEGKEILRQEYNPARESRWGILGILARGAAGGQYGVL